jgi:E3 ubiquitin-protein ligase RGLG
MLRWLFGRGERRSSSERGGRRSGGGEGGGGGASAGAGARRSSASAADDDARRRSSAATSTSADAAGRRSAADAAPAAQPPRRASAPAVTQLGAAGARHPHAIPDRFARLADVQAALRRRGLAACALVVAVDFTQSNTWTGKRAFAGRCLHALDAPGPGPGAAPAVNPYERALRVISRALAPFDDDGRIPCYGFGDSRTRDERVFSFFDGGAPAAGGADLVRRYRQLAPAVALAGPTSFAPAIRAAAAAARAAGNALHLLLLLADGQLTRGSETPRGALSAQEAATVAALVDASHTAALAVVLVGLGDGPWDMMRAFDDALPARGFDNFHFVEMEAVRGGPGEAWDAAFALACLQELPEAHAQCAERGLLGRVDGGAAAAAMPRVLPPPLRGAPSGVAAAPPQPQPRAQPQPQPPQQQQHQRGGAAAEACAVCMDAPRDAAFVPCGHVALCCRCAAAVMATSRRCPICRAAPQTHLRVYL